MMAVENDSRVEASGAARSGSVSSASMRGAARMRTTAAKTETELRGERRKGGVEVFLGDGVHSAG